MKYVRLAYYCRQKRQKYVKNQPVRIIKLKYMVDIR